MGARQKAGDVELVTVHSWLDGPPIERSPAIRVPDADPLLARLLVHHGGAGPLDLAKREQLDRAVRGMLAGEGEE